MINKNELILNTVSIFKDKFKNKPDIISLAPGRINIIGEHTDYNLGLAIPTAINRWICVAISKEKGSSIKLYNNNYKFDFNFSLFDEIYKDSSWMNLVRRTFKIFKNEYNLNNSFNIAINSNIPIGCGLSSSTAFTISLINAISKCLSISLSKSEQIILSQKIEKISMKTNGGLLDQFSILMSKKSKLMLIDFQNNGIKYFSQKSLNQSWIVVNSKINRELSNSKYNDRVSECNKGFNFLKEKINIKKYSNLKESILNKYPINDKIINKRIRHVISENNRVKSMYKAFLKHDSTSIGIILFDSHKSLSFDYEVSCKEIDYLIDCSSKIDGWRGGRIIGGGFGGCTINLIENQIIENYSKIINEKYFKRYGIHPDIFPIVFSNGAEVNKYKKNIYNENL